MYRTTFAISLFALMVVSAAARAGEAPKTRRESALACGNCYECGRFWGPPCDRHARSGYGLCVAPWARWTYDCNYLSYYVGGSARPRTHDWRVRPEPRYPWEGTWGTDYSPVLTATELWWTHGRLYQDGPGQYEPDRRNLPVGLKLGE